MKKIFLISLLNLTLYISGQTYTRFMPIPPTPQQCIFGTCAPIQKTSDNGYILNYSYGYPNWDVSGPKFSEIVKTDSLFVPQWRKELNGENGKKTFSFSDGTSIIYTSSNGVGVEKINNSGQSLWTNRFNRTYPLSMSVNNAIYQNSNIKLAGYITQYNGFGNSIYTSALLLDIDTTGNFIHADSLVISSFFNSSIEHISNDAMGNYYIMGSGMASGGNSFVCKINSSNTLVWCKKLNSSVNAHSYSASTILSNGDLLVGGSVYDSNVGTSAIILLRFSSIGNLIWSKTVPYPSNVSSVQETTNGNILVSGIHRSVYGDTLKNILFKIDTNGNPIWTKRYNAGFSISSVYQKNNNDWYFTAFTTEPILFNTDSLGITSCPFSNFNLTLNNLPVTVNSISASLYPITIPNSILTTSVISSQTYSDGCTNVLSSINEFNVINKISIFPNPSLGSFNITSSALIDKIIVTNIYGYEIINFKPNTLKFELKINDVGVYFVTIIADSKTTTEKVIINK